MIYIDVLWLTNLTVGLLASYVVGALSGSRIRMVGCLLAAGIGACGAVWLFLFCNSSVLFGAVMLSIILLTVSLSFRPTTVGAYLYLSVLYFGTLFFFGSAVTYLLGIMIRKLGVRHSGQVGTKAWLFFGLSLSIAVGMELLSYIRKRQSLRKRILLRIVVNDRSQDVPCILDSGCLIREPISGQPVFFVPQQYAKRMLGSKDTATVASADIDAMTDLAETLRHITRLVPCRTVRGKSILMCIKSKVFVYGIEKQGWMAIIDSSGEHKEGICPTSLVG